VPLRARGGYEQLKTISELSSGWKIKKINPVAGTINQNDVTEGEWLDVNTMPAQVHDILLEHKMLPEEMLVGWCENVEWVNKYDWLYHCTFEGDIKAQRSVLKFRGLDTVADIYLNGELIGKHDNLFISKSIDITSKLKKNNSLLIHFHNILDYLATIPYPEEWSETVTRCKLVRKPIHDFPPEVYAGSNYQGAYRYFSPIGVYDTIELISTGEAEIVGDWLRTSLDASLKDGALFVNLDGLSSAESVNIHVILSDPESRKVAFCEKTVPVVDKEWSFEKWIEIDSPQPWYPRGYGAQPLYTVTVDVLVGSTICDSLTKQIGFRHIEMPYPLAFTVNGKKVRMWGGSMDPFQGYTHCWRRARVMRLLDMVENANMNTLRIWGEGIPYRDEFYEECDRRGIIVWQEFFLCFAAHPNTKEYREKYKIEAKELILRLRHHTSLFMWCSGNETIMGSEFLNREKQVYGIEMIDKDFPELVGKLDPGRYYHRSSPSGGEWANDPRVGDMHTYDCVWYYPHKEFPNFISEHIRTAPPVLHSLKKMIRGPLWPKEYDGKFMHNQEFPMPESWMERTHHPAKGHVKTGPYWEYYDADNPYDMVYRFAAAYGQEMRNGLERVRMGGPTGDTPPARRGKGHLSCKLNDTWPKVYCTIIDFFQEGFIPYYATQAAQTPVLVCFDVRDEINLWLVNDSMEDICGTVKFGLFDIYKNEFVFEKTIDAAMEQGASDIIYNLNELKFFQKWLLPYARFEDEAGKWESVSIDYIDIERHYQFPEAKLDVKLIDDILEISTDKFARCVEITGVANGDEFGWLFSSNYFDLVPGDTRRVKIMGRQRGEITVKAHYSPHKTIVKYN